jgi:putative signal transducing protein
VKPSDFDKQYENFAAHYSRMSDGELLKLASEPWALSDSAWDALEDELEQRNLDVPESPEVPQASLPEKRDLVLLRRFRDVHEALLAKGRLEASGIECFLADENMVRMDWFISNLLGGVKLLVEPADFSKASHILNESLPHEFDADEAE